MSSSPSCPCNLELAHALGRKPLSTNVAHGWALPPPDHVLLQLDFTNAFNSLSRTSLLQAVHATCPIFSSYAASCYANPATLYADGFQLSSEEGEHQGCPCGPLFFAVTTLPLAQMAQLGSSGWSHWYLDDGYIAGHRATLNDLLPRLEAASLSLGLQLNRKKCGLLIPGTLEMPDTFFLDIPRIPNTDCMGILGSPVGGPLACQQWVQDQVLAPYGRALSRLEALGCPRAASLILRQCLSACKVSWILRTAAPEVAQWTATQASPMLRHAWGVVMGMPLPDPQWRLSTLPIRDGGGGLQDPLDIVEAANVSSWLCAATSPVLPDIPLGPPSPALLAIISKLADKAPQLGSPLKDALSKNGVAAVRQHLLRSSWCHQSTWADEFMKTTTATFDQEVVERLKCLRRLHSAPSSGLWLTTNPFLEQGPTFSALEWQGLLRFRVGMPLFPAPSCCRACLQPMDPFGDHALSCSASGLYRRHNRLRDLMYLLTQQAGWAPDIEVAIPSSSLRPADLLFRSGFPKPLACDVTVSHPLRHSATHAVRGEPDISASEAEDAKNRDYRSLCHAAGWGFRPMGFETTGGLGPSAVRTLKQLCHQLSMRQGLPSSEVADYLHRLFSLALAKGRGEMLAASNPSTDSLL